MKKLSLITLWFISSLSLAEVKAIEKVAVELPCYKTKELMIELLNTYKEYPLVYGIVDDVANSKMSLWSNPANDSWTIVATKDDLSCIVGVGTELKLVTTKKSKIF